MNKINCPLSILEVSTDGTAVDSVNHKMWMTSPAKNDSDTFLIETWFNASDKYGRTDHMIGTNERNLGEVMKSMYSRSDTCKYHSGKRGYSFAGFSDWRLPSMREAMQLFINPEIAGDFQFPTHSDFIPNDDYEKSFRALFPNYFNRDGSRRSFWTASPCQERISSWKFWNDREPTAWAFGFGSPCLIDEYCTRDFHLLLIRDL